MSSRHTVCPPFASPCPLLRPFPLLAPAPPPPTQILVPTLFVFLLLTLRHLYRWYRCPELLLGARSYSTGCDNWAAGCIFAELMLRVPFMAAESDMEQLNMIFSALGTPGEAEWPVRLLLITNLCSFSLSLPRQCPSTATRASWRSLERN